MNYLPNSHFTAVLWINPKFASSPCVSLLHLFQSRTFTDKRYNAQAIFIRAILNSVALPFDQIRIAGAIIRPNTNRMQMVMQCCHHRHKYFYIYTFASSSKVSSSSLSQTTVPSLRQTGFQKN